MRGDLIAILGDTPAVSKAGGFKEGVGFADKKCRHCMATGNDIQSKVSTCVYHPFTCVCNPCRKYTHAVATVLYTVYDSSLLSVSVHVHARIVYRGAVYCKNVGDAPKTVYVSGTTWN